MRNFYQFVESKSNLLYIGDFADRMWLPLTALWNASGILGLGILTQVDPKKPNSPSMIRSEKEMYGEWGEEQGRKVWMARKNHHDLYKKAAIENKEIPQGVGGGFYNEAWWNPYEIYKKKRKEKEDKIDTDLEERRKEGRSLIWDEMDRRLKAYSQRNPENFAVGGMRIPHQDWRQILEIHARYNNGKWELLDGSVFSHEDYPEPGEYSYQSRKYNKLMRERKNWLTSMDMEYNFKEASKLFFFDYLAGKPIKASFHPYQKYIDPHMYNTRNSPQGNVNHGVASMVIDALRKSGDPVSMFWSAMGQAQTDKTLEKAFGINKEFDSKLSPKGR